MVFSGNGLGIVLALISAVVWGSGDFSGGLAARKANPFQVLALSALSGLVILGGCVLVWREVWPSPGGMLWAGLAGGAAALGAAALYRGLSLGHAASVAPTAGVIGAALPVLFSIITQGWPGAERLAGFGLAFLGIWFVARAGAGAERVSREGFLLACLAGAGFGGFFILIAQIDPGTVFSSLIVARCVGLGIALLLLRVNRLPVPAIKAHPVALLAGVLDAGGNIFYVLARQYTRLDIAAVLSSLYPAATVILASLLLKEKISRGQLVGVGLCLVAIGLITAS